MFFYNTKQGRKSLDNLGGYYRMISGTVHQLKITVYITHDTQGWSIHQIVRTTIVQQLQFSVQQQ